MPDQVAVLSDIHGVLPARDTSIPDPVVPWAAAQLDAEHVRLLKELPLTEQLAVPGLGEVLFCHATPRDDEEIVLVDSPLERWSAVLAGVWAGTVVCGHTHMPFLRLVDRTLVINPGSVGMPYGSTGAHWALLGGGDGPAVQLRRTLFDAEATCAAVMASCGYPEIERWVDFFIRNPASDVEAHSVFSAQAERK